MLSVTSRPNGSFAQGVQEDKDIIKGKFSNKITHKSKRQVWVKIATAINAVFPSDDANVELFVLPSLRLKKFLVVLGVPLTTPSERRPLKIF